jgi:anti-sigma regulatory factor (Ser/Thr protein kinase)
MQLDYVLELPNDLRAIERSVDYLMDKGREVGFDYDRLRLNFRVGLTEALANAMLYGNCRDPRKRVRVEAHLSAREIKVQVTDEGRGFDPDAVLDPTLPANRARRRPRHLPDPPAHGPGRVQRARQFDHHDPAEPDDAARADPDRADEDDDLADLTPLPHAGQWRCWMRSAMRAGAELRLWARGRRPVCLYPRPAADGAWPPRARARRRWRTAAARARGPDGRRRRPALARVPGRRARAGAAPRAGGALGGARADGALRGDQPALLHQRDPRLRAVGAGRGDADPRRGRRRARRPARVALGLRPRRTRLHIAAAVGEDGLRARSRRTTASRRRRGCSASGSR